MKASAVFQKLFAMVGGNCQRTFVPKIELAQLLRQLPNLRISPANAGIVQRHHLVAFSQQALASHAFPLPKGIQILRLLCSDCAALDFFESLSFWIVR